MARAERALTGFWVRIIASIAVVLLTYNPTGYSYVHWLQGLWTEGAEPNTALLVLAGLVLLAAYAVLLRATFFSIGTPGIVLVGGIIAAIVWVMIEFGVLDLNQTGVLEWIVLIGIGIVLGVGLSWALIRRRLSGQVSVDDVEETQ
jgi:ABC-type uncharacterized transport system permease subunit